MYLEAEEQHYTKRWAGDEDRFPTLCDDLLDSRVVFWPPGQLTSRLGKYGIPQCPQHLLDRLVL